jgi:hypothetical protein
MSIRTEEAYVPWAKRFILFHHKRHPGDMGTPEIRTFQEDYGRRLAIVFASPCCPKSERLAAPIGCAHWTCLLYGIQPCRHLTGEAHRLTVCLYDILNLRCIAASHRSHNRDADATTGG